MLPDLRLVLYQSVADDAFPVLAAAGEMSCLLPPTLPAGFPAGSRKSSAERGTGQKYRPKEVSGGDGRHE